MAMIKYLLAILIFLSPQLRAEVTLPRTVITLYDREVYPDIWYTRMHQYAEMPLNHLGLKLEYHEINEGLPDIAGREDVLGVFVWFPKYTEIRDPMKYIEWVSETVKSGKKFVVMGTTGLEHQKEPLPISAFNRFWNNMGLSYGDDWVDDTYQIEFPVIDRTVVDFERRYRDMMAPFDVLKLKDPEVQVHLMARRDGDESTDSVLVCTGPNGGFASEGYEKYEVFNENENFRKWYVNPFRFFELAFALGHAPVPDTTTMNGKRIYYSHIDGDGWNSITELEQYRRERTICAEVVYRELIEPYPQLPVTVGAIAADLDEKWEGRESSREAARKLFALQHVEPSSHTYSHPFKWDFFDHFRIEDEEPYLDFYVTKTWQGASLWKQIKRLLGYSGKVHGKDVAVHTDAEKIYNPNIPADTDSNRGTEKILTEYDIPRAYANYPFDLDLELQGSIDKVAQYCPKGKPVMLYQWSGDCQPFERAVAKVGASKISNINGGDTRFDSEFLSYAWVRPLGRQSGKSYQVYASASNENTYTDLWHSRFYGFKHLPETLDNTDSPLRLKPINVYYHMYSGEKLASLNAVKSNLNYALKQEIIPIETSAFSKIVEGFNSVQLSLHEGGWMVKNRGELQTLRFDRSVLSFVDFDRSRGVLGSRHLYGSLYVFLDPAVEVPVVHLVEATDEKANLPILEASSWRFWDVRHSSNDMLSCSGRGYGSCQMKWRVPKDGLWEVVLGDERETFEAKEGVLNISMGNSTFQPVSLQLKFMDSKSSL